MLYFIQSILILLISFSHANENVTIPLEILKRWSNILYISDNYSPSGEWFSGNKHNSLDEFHHHLKNSDNLKCLFPMRSTFLFENGFINDLDLSQCEELMSFSKSLSFNNISLMLTSELLDSPASSYGHISIVFHNNTTPELDSEVIHFSAVQKDEGLKSTISGLTGGLYGYFFKDKFHKKYFEYSIKEQRKIHLWKLNLSESEKKYLTLSLFELKKAQFRYYFLGKNCSFQIAKLLEVVTGINVENKFVFLPSTNIEIFQSRLSRPSTIFPRNENLKFYQEQNLKNCYNREKNLIDFYSNNNPSEHYIQTNLDNYCFNDTSFASEEESTLYLNNLNTRTSVSFNYNSNTKETYLNLALRPTAKDIYDFQNFNENLEFNLLNTSLNIYSKKVDLNEFNLIELKNSRYDNDNVLNAWKFSTGLNRKNVKEESRVEISYSKGINRNTNFNFVSTQYFLLIGGNIENNLEGKNYINLDITSQLIFEKNKFKLLYQTRIKKNLTETYINHELNYLNRFFDHSLFIAINLNKNFTYSTGFYYYF